MTVNGFSNFICLTIWKSMPGMADNGTKKEATHSHTEFLWHMVKSRWHRFDQNNNMDSYAHVVFMHVTEAALGPCTALTFPVVLFNLYFICSYTNPAPFLSALAVVVFAIQFYNVQCKFHIYFHHLKKIVPVSRNENEYRTYNNNHDHWIRKRVFYCFLCVCALLYYIC